MGLPLFVTPVEPDEVAKTVDKDAAQSRSAIRRPRAARRANHDPRPRDRSARQPISGSAPLLLPDPAPDLTGVVPSSSSSAARLESSVATAAVRRRAHDAGRPFTQDFIGFPMEMDRPRDTLSTDPAAVHPSQAQVRSDPRERRVGRRPGQLRRWIERTRGQDPQRPPSLSRQETSADLSTNAGTNLPALTPDFSPARPHALQETLDRPGSHSPLEYVFQPIASTRDLDRTSTFMPRQSPLPDPNIFRELQPLRRMGRRSLADMQSGRRRMPVDGLGDRDRSLSPDGDVVWETMLTTLTPDPQLPSVGSSFTSVSAVTSASSNNESSSTSLTTIGSRRSPMEAINAAVDNICDLIEDTQDSSGDEDTDLEEEEDLYELQDGLESRDRFWRPHADVAASRADRIARYQHGRAEADTLGGMQRIVRRLARREDIPDEWWAEAGLSRNFPRESVRL